MKKKESRILCDECKNEIESIKKIKKVGKRKLCNDCYMELKLRHRKETFENSEDKEEIIRLEKLRKNEYQKERYERLKKE